MSPRQNWLAAIAAFISIFFIAATAPAQDLTTWTEEGMRLPDGVDSTPVLLPDGRIRLYYSTNTLPDGIVSALSADGLTFTRDPGVREPFSAGAGFPIGTRIMPLPNGQYRIFYSTGRSGGGIASGISSDGLNFTDEPGLRVLWSDLGATNGTDGGTIVKLTDGTYRMYIGVTGPPNTTATAYIRSATSPDMINWTVEPGIRVGNAPGSPAKSEGANHPFALANGNFDVTPSIYPTGQDAPHLMLSAFGQSDDRVTPLQIALDSAAIANGGVEMQPNLIKKIIEPDLSELNVLTPKVYGTPISATTAAAVRDMMVSSVAAGAASNARIVGVQVAGKTGTAQNGVHDPYTLWFTGFAPANDPQVVVAVVIENGGGRGQDSFGNQIAAPIGKAVMEAVLNK